MCAVAQLCLTLCLPVDCSPEGPSVHGIFQARMLEPFPSLGDLPHSGIEPTSLMSPVLAGGFFTTSTTRKCQLPPSQTAKRLPTMQETWVQSLGQEDLLEKGMATTPVFLPGESHGERSWQSIVHGVAKSQT